MLSLESCGSRCGQAYGEKASPANRHYSGDGSLLGSEANRELAQEAVRKSLVLLKNDNQILPLDHTKALFVVGSGADDIQRQTGGWSLTWQGDENTIERDFPGASTVLRSTQKLLGTDKVNTNVDEAEHGDVALVVFGEFLRGNDGGYSGFETIEYAGIKRAYQKDLALLRSLKERGVNVVSVFFSGQSALYDRRDQSVGRLCRCLVARHRSRRCGRIIWITAIMISWVAYRSHGPPASVAIL